LTAFENFLFEQAKIRFSNNNVTVNNAIIYGCGTGRDINEVVKFFGNIKISAYDISSNMIKKCLENIQLWRLSNIETTVCDVVNYPVQPSNYELSTILNSMLTYVPEKDERIQIFKNSYTSLKDNGVILGVVHNQVGVFTKTMYFKLRRVFKIFLKEDVGHRYSGSIGYKVKSYYYTKEDLIKDLQDSNFKNIEVYSLEEYFAMQGQK
jgi:ubiquinone/menaquinone biosynthesis C-methylase UbiE